MDPLAGFLDGPRARSAFVLRCVLDPPWSIRVRDEAPLAVVAVTRGHAWFVPEGSGDADAPVLLGTGDMLIVRAGPTFEHVATNAIGELLMATPALSEGVMYVRGTSSLFAIGAKR